VSTFCDAAAGPAAEGEIITVFAPKGGAGTTTLATNLGVVLARAGHRVCVVNAALVSELLGVRAPIAARIPYSRAVPRSINNYLPITLWSRRNQVSKAIAGFAQEHLLSAPPASLPNGARGDASPCLLGRLRDRWRTA
jgi:MinD superfamily P-loop ATPase